MIKFQHIKRLTSGQDWITLSCVFASSVLG